LKVEKFYPEINKIYPIEEHSFFHIIAGEGSIQVDFKNYFDWQQKGIFLEEGQYIKFVGDNFTVRKIEFYDDDKFYNKEVRVLFKHFVSLGYIDFEECEDCKVFLSESMLPKNPTNIIDISSKQWYWQNPFNANKEEYQIIFDAKDIIDNGYMNHMSNRDLVSLINKRGHNAQVLIKNKVGLSIKNLINEKRLVKSKKEIAFTDKSIQEI
jgi:YesN/AraC family two-component response regulator